MSRTMLAAVVHVQRSHGRANAPLNRPEIDGDWPLHQQDAAAVEEFLDSLEVLLAVAYRRVAGSRTLVVIDVRRITGFALVAGHRVRFSTAAAPELSHLVGQTSPVRWRRGQAWPVTVTEVRPVVASPAGSSSAA